MSQTNVTNDLHGGATMKPIVVTSGWPLPVRERHCLTSLFSRVMSRDLSEVKGRRAGSNVCEQFVSVRAGVCQQAAMSELVTYNSHQIYNYVTHGRGVASIF